MPFYLMPTFPSSSLTTCFDQLGKLLHSRPQAFPFLSDFWTPDNSSQIVLASQSMLCPNQNFIDAQLNLASDQILQRPELFYF